MHGYGKSQLSQVQFLITKSTINGQFSTAMSNCQRTSQDVARKRTPPAAPSAVAQQRIRPKAPDRGKGQGGQRLFGGPHRKPGFNTGMTIQEQICVRKGKERKGRGKEKKRKRKGKRKEEEKKTKGRGKKRKQSEKKEEKKRKKRGTKRNVPEEERKRKRKRKK